MNIDEAIEKLTEMKAKHGGNTELINSMGDLVTQIKEDWLLGELYGVEIT